MKKTLITILIILILGGLGYFAYSKGLIKLDFLRKSDSLIENPNISNEVTKEAEKFSDVGESIQGDFNGDGIKEVASVKIVKEGYGNPVEDGKPSVYELQFSNDALPSLNLEKIANNPVLINEGDLNADGADDISLYGRPLNGMTYDFSTYSYINKKWTNIIPFFLIDIGQVPNSDKYISLGAQEFQDRVFKDGDSFSYIPDQQIVHSNGKDFKVQLVSKGEWKSGTQNFFFRIYNGLNKIFEEGKEDNGNVDRLNIFDFNGDGHNDIQWVINAPNGHCVTDYMVEESLFLFDAKTNTFVKTEISTSSKNMKSNSKYYFYTQYSVCTNFWSSTLFTIENNKQINKGLLKYNEDMNNPIIEVYKDKNLINTIKLKKQDLNIYDDFGETVSNPKFDDQKYWEENYKKFE